MIIEELIENGERIRRYSNAGRYLVQGGTGNIYEEAVDPVNVDRSYTEGEIMPEENEDMNLVNKAEAYDILMGVIE